MIKSVEKVKHTRQASIEQTCQCYDMHRDSYYKLKGREQKKAQVTEQVLELVKEERIEQSRVGTVKLYKALKGTFEASGLKVGRDKLNDILREHNMLIGRKKASCKTTDSYHRFHKYKNLVKDMVVTAPNQVWVADITYIRTINGFCYLALITDMYSRKIVGYDISDSLRCLQKKCGTLGPEQKRPPRHYFQNHFTTWKIHAEQTKAIFTILWKRFCFCVFQLL